MKIFLLAPNTYEDWKNVEAPLCTPPLNLMYLSSVLEKAGHKTKIMDAYCNRSKITDVLRQIKSFAPDFIGIVLYANDLKLTYNQLNRIKSTFPHIKQFLGGIYSSQLPNRTLNEFKSVDYLLRGESENSVVEFFNLFEQGKSFEKVPGLSYRKNKKIINNPLPKIIENLDLIPIPDRSNIAHNKYFSVLAKNNPLDVIITSRGCPYNCIFCSKLSKDFCKYRVRSPENVVEEIQLIIDKGAKFIDIYDETFTVDQKRCFNILQLCKKEKLDFEFRVRTRVDNVNRQLLRRLKKAGCSFACYGVESGNDHILKTIRKGITKRMTYDAFKKTHKEGIETLAFSLIGLPGDTPQTIMDTINFTIKLNPLIGSFTNVLPYPGTEMYENSKKDGSLVGDWSVHNELPWTRLSWTRSRDDIIKYIDLAFKKFYFRPEYMYKFTKYLLMTRNWGHLSYAIRNLSNRKIREGTGFKIDVKSIE